MNNREFSESMERQYARCKELLCTKQAEYTPDKDVFEVFKKASTLCGEGGVKSAIFDFMLKHIVSISDMCHTDKEFSLDRWNEKLTDAMNYLFLLKAYVEEDEHNHEGERYFECGEIGCDNCKFNTTCTFNSMYNKHGKCVQGFEWIPDKLSYVSWDELAKAVNGDTNSSCCMNCNECDYCVCDCTEDALLSCNNNCYGCPHMGCTKDMEPLDLTHLVQEPNKEPISTYGYKECTKEPRDCRLCDYAIWSLGSDKETDRPFCFKKESDGCSGYARTPYWKEENKAEEEVTQEDWEDFWREDDELSDKIAIAKEFENEFQ